MLRCKWMTVLLTFIPVLLLTGCESMNWQVTTTVNGKKTVKNYSLGPGQKKQQKNSNQRIAKTDSNRPADSSRGGFNKGDRVLVLRQFIWFPGKVFNSNFGGVWIDWDDNRIPKRGTASQNDVRAYSNWKPGTQIQCDGKNQNQYTTGTINKISGDNISLVYPNKKTANVRVGLCRESAIVLSPSGFDYRKQIPTPEKVISDIQGKNKLDTAARQYAALILIRDMADVFRDAYHAENWTKEDQAINRLYMNAQSKVLSLVNKELDPGGQQRYVFDSPMDKWSMSSNQYLMGDPSFVKSLVERYFSPGLQAGYLFVRDKNQNTRMASLDKMYKERRDMVSSKKAEKEAIKKETEEKAEEDKQMQIHKDILETLQKYEFSYNDTTAQTERKKRFSKEAMEGINKKYAGKYWKFNNVCVNDVRAEDKGNIMSSHKTGRFEVWFGFKGLLEYFHQKYGFDSTWLYMKNYGVAKIVADEKTALAFEKDKCLSISGKVQDVSVEQYGSTNIIIKLE